MKKKQGSPCIQERKILDLRVIEAASSTILVLFHSQRARSMHDVAYGMNSVRSKDAH